MSGRGIDYGMGTTNIDRETGIRYGVIPMHDLSEWAHEDFAADYGPATCPKCGNEAVDADADKALPENVVKALEWMGFPADAEIDVCDDGSAYVGLTQILPPGSVDEPLTRDAYKVLHHACGDYACDDCRLLFDGEDAFGDDVCEWIVDDGEYKATQGGDDSDVFILLSPYFTRAQFCSPCAPGACHLSNPTEDGERAYCFGHDWFEDDVAPYPVYSVKTGELVAPPVK